MLDIARGRRRRLSDPGGIGDAEASRTADHAEAVEASLLKLRLAVGGTRRMPARSPRTDRRSARSMVRGRLAEMAGQT